jgi:hypothetical protein
VHLFKVSWSFTDVSFNLSCITSSSLDVVASFWLQLSRDIFSSAHRPWNHKNPMCKRRAKCQENRQCAQITSIVDVSLKTKKDFGRCNCAWHLKY